MKKILIIGNQGYLGSRLTDYLLERGYDCKGIDTGFFKEGVISSHHQVSTISKDARNIETKDLHGYDALVLLAGISNDPFGHMTSEQIYNPTRDYALKIAKMCKKLDIKFIYPSSCSVYGAATDKGYLNETSQTNPQTPYSLNKLQVEEGLSEIADNSFSPIALRFGTIYGMSPRIRFDLVINMLCGLALTTGKIALNSNGQAWRPHLHIDDACQSIKSCLDWDNKSGSLTIFNVGQNQDNYKIIDIAKIINSNISGSELTFLGNKSNDDENQLIVDRKIQDGVDSRTYMVSFDQIHNTLTDFQCRWTIKKGVKALLDELRNIDLSKEVFNKREFYRLQHLEYLHENGILTDNLEWRI